MNNRYIFRGKRKDNGEWVYGGIYYQKSDDVKDEAIYIVGGSLNDVGCAYEVFLETIGQCTGLKDKNGKLIFEGDIVRTKKYGRVIAHSTVRDYDIFRITYAPAVFRLENIRRAFNLVGNSADYEVIGNIHAKQELHKLDHDSLCETETYLGGKENAKIK